ncbi:MAG: glycoside hydrolase family 55 protein [Pirellulaceae bacterium]|nr:glycoside hydrolase family 55 protein [Pirellulaceae bacterium]
MDMRLSSALCSLLVGWIMGGSPTFAQTPGRWNVVEHGAVADGTTDNTAVFQAALDAARQAGGGIVDVPAGRFRFDGTLTIPAGVTLQGTYRVPPTADRRNVAKPDGSVLLTFAGRGSTDGPAFIQLSGQNAAVAGLVIAYPEWSADTVPPVPYPPCIASEGTENVGILDCCLLNPYEAIKLVRAHRHLVRNVTGYPSKRGIFVDECYDIGHIENIHFWPFGVTYQQDDPYCKWINTEGVAFELARTDWHYVSNTFCFGYGVGYKFSASQAGATNGNFLGLGADSCRRAVLVEQAQPPGLLITNGEFVGRWGSTDSVCIEIGDRVEGKVSLVNCSFWGPIDRCVWMRSPFGQFTASACHFVHWDNHKTGAPALQLDAGKAMVQACTFARDGLHVAVGPEVRHAILMGNQAASGFRVDNHAGARMTSLGNEQHPLDATPEARSHYQIDIGAMGDDRFLEGWSGREERSGAGPLGTARWSTGVSRICLPVVPESRYRVTVALRVPPQAESDEAGLYLDGERIAPLDRTSTSIAVELPPTSATQRVLELRCHGWIPRDVVPGSRDDRTLGVEAMTITMRADGAEERVFDANRGGWCAADDHPTSQP